MRALNKRPEVAREYQLWLYPLCNPTGFIDATRASRECADLNREFWRGSTEPEVQLLEAEIRRQRFDGIISLHTDDTCDGVYGFARGASFAEQVLRPALAAAQHTLPRAAASMIDGFQACNGIIRTCYEGVLSAPAEQQPSPFEIVLETPQLAPMRLQRQAFVHALATILAQYRRILFSEAVFVRA